MAVRRRVRLALLCALMGATAPARQTPGPGDLIDSVLAVVEGRVIMLSDVRAFVELRLIEPLDAADPTAPVLTTLIERQLVLEEVARYVVAEPQAAEVDARVADVVARTGGPETFGRLLPVVGFTVDDVRQVLRDDLRIERYLDRRFGAARQPTEEAALLRQGLIDDWVASLTVRSDVFRAVP